MICTVWNGKMSIIFRLLLSHFLSPLHKPEPSNIPFPSSLTLDPPVLLFIHQEILCFLEAPRTTLKKEGGRQLSAISHFISSAFSLHRVPRRPDYVSHSVFSLTLWRHSSSHGHDMLLFSCIFSPQF